MKRIVLIGIPLVAFVGLLGWRIQGKRLEAAGQARSRDMRMNAPAVVTLATARRRDIVQSFDCIGNVEAPFNVHISAKVAGRIDYLVVREGDRVTRGQVLVRLDPTELQAQVAQQLANVAQARFRLSQARLNEAPTNVGVNAQIIQQSAGLSTAVANLNQARSNSAALIATAEANVRDAQGKVDAANAAVNQQEANVRSAQSSLDNAQTKYNRVYGLYKQGYIAAQDVDDARTTISVQKGALDVASRQRDSAAAQRDSAHAQRSSAEQQLNIARTKAKTDVAATQAQMKQAKAILSLAQANTILKPAFLENLAALREGVLAAEAQYRVAQAQLAQTSLTSSIDGFVTDRSADPGTLATSGQPILTVQNIRQVFVSVSVPEEVSRHVYAGQTATVRLDALPGRSFIGKITQLNPSADPTSRQFAARVTLDNPQFLVKPGMFAHVLLVTQRSNGVLTVPREAVSEGKLGATVTVVDKAGKAHVRPVKTAPGDDRDTAIRSGLAPGEKVVVLASRSVRDGQAVRVSGPGGGKGRGGRGPGGSAPRGMSGGR